MKEEGATMQRVGIDVGGTFTDLFVWDPRTGSGRTAKSLTTPYDLTDGVFASLAAGGVDLRQVDFLVHGSTTAVNALLERSFPEPAFVTTAGFRDVVEVGRIHRERLYDPYQRKPQQLVSRRNRFTVTERTRPDGSERTPLDEDELRAVAREIAARGIANVAVGFLNSYADGAHERRAREILREEIPGALVAISSDVPKFRELGRFTTAIVRAALLPVMGDYFGRLESRLAEHGFDGALCVIKSNGGIVRAAVAREHPEELIESGPAGGVAAAGHLSATTGRRRLVTTDMGGTSFDVCLVEDGHGLVRDDYEIAWDMPVIAPMLDIRSIGAGGGSIAWIDDGGSLRVGPRSAGSNPGPACYGRGGRAPTVTDANLVLGRLDASLGGRFTLDRDAAEAAIATVAEPLGLDVLTCAEGILHICTESMAGAIKMISVDRGRDQRDYAVVTFGGAGAMHSAAIAASLGIREVIVPPFAGVASAYGATAMDVRLDVERTVYSSTRTLDPAVLQRAVAELEAEVVSQLADHGFTGEQTRLRRSAGMRYVGQSYEVETPLPDGPLGADGVAAAVEAFHAAHEREHGVRSDDFEVAFVNLRVTGEGILPKPALDSSAGGPGGQADGAAPPTAGSRPVYFGGAWHETPVHDSAALLPGHALAGPAVVQYPETTLVLPPGSRGQVDAVRNVVIELDGAAAVSVGGSPATTAVGG
jgi:N-methylhydantoinase A